jgi:hypothetical protein
MADHILDEEGEQEVHVLARDEEAVVDILHVEV